MDVVSAALSMCAGSIAGSLLIMVIALNLAYAARRWFTGIKRMGDL
jgi:hypothetical protein